MPVLSLENSIREDRLELKYCPFSHFPSHVSDTPLKADLSFRGKCSLPEGQETKPTAKCHKQPYETPDQKPELELP